MSMDFMDSFRPSAPHITPTPRELCRLAAPAVWCLPSRTAWSPHPWARPALMFSTEPSRLTQALQCMICLRLPPASLGSLFAMGLKITHSCRSVLWTVVLASSPLSILKARSSLGLCCTSRTFWLLATFCSHTLTECTKKDVNQISGTCRVTVFGRQDWMVKAGFTGIFAVAPFSLWVCWIRWPAGLSSQREFRVSLYWIPVTSWLSALKGPNDVHIKM